MSFAKKQGIATTRSPAARISLFFTGLGFAFAVAMGSNLAIAATPATQQYMVPMETFMKDFMTASAADHFTVSGNLNVPAIWLYSPQGKLTTVANDDSGLEAMMRAFPPAKATAPANQANLKDLLGVLAKSSGKPADLGPSAPTGRWTAVLFTMNSPQCHHCAEFERTMQKFGGAHADALNNVTVTLKMP